MKSKTARLTRIRDRDFVKNIPTRPIGQRGATNVLNTGSVCPDCRTLQGLAKTAVRPRLWAPNSDCLCTLLKR